jgi:DNA-binding transcriptional LysR family regulator
MLARGEGRDFGSASHLIAVAERQHVTQAAEALNLAQ